MTATIQKWGNSLALRIPAALARQIHVEAGDAVTLRVDASELTVKAISQRPSLDDLLAGVNAENLHASTDWGADRGREILAE